jgi:hypothetical protein
VLQLQTAFLRVKKTEVRYGYVVVGSDQKRATDGAGEVAA